MHQIIYLSRATQKMNSAELVALLTQARSSNERVGITGALVYGEGQFMQIVEGERVAITALYERILGDRRHQAVAKLVDKPIEKRMFSNWSMAFRELPPAQMTELKGYISPEHWEQAHVASNAMDTLLLNHMRAVVLKDSN